MSTLPRHLQISEMLTREIKAGLRRDGDRLPPERVLAGECGVSVGTLRKALADLAEKGMLERVHGSGNYVRDNPEVSSIYALFRLEKASGGGLPSARLLGVDMLPRPSDVPKFDAAAHAFRFRRIRALDGVDVAAEEMWLGGTRAEHIEARDVGDSLYQFYAEHLGFRITRVEDRVSLAPLPDWAAARFTDPHPGPWGYVERLSRDEAGLCAEFSRTWFDPRNTRFVAR